MCSSFVCRLMTKVQRLIVSININRALGNDGHTSAVILMISNILVITNTM